VNLSLTQPTLELIILMVADTTVLEAVAEIVGAPMPSPSTMSPTPSSTAERSL